MDCYKLLEENKKKCYACQEIKLIDDFCLDKRGIGGKKNSCRDCQKKRRAEYYKLNKEKENLAGKEYKKKNVERCSELSKQWRQNNPDKVRARKRRYYLKNMKNPKFKLETNIANSIRKRIKLNRQDRKLQEILGYAMEDLMRHLESKFKEGMNWENQGTYWHIDHIKPKSWFNYQSINDPSFKECWALSNLQPLEASLNCSKQNRYEG